MLKDFIRPLCCLPLIALVGCATVAPVAPVATSNVEIQNAVAMAANNESAAERIRRDIAWLADDAREGREAGTDAYRQAAEYTAARMAGLGVTPGANGSWFQEVPLRSGAPNPDASTMSISEADGTVHQLTNLDDFLVYPSIEFGTFSLENVPAVFVGYGVSAPEFGHDDYAGVDVKGKVVVYFSGVPKIFDNESQAHFNSRGLKYKEAAARGAVGIISLSTTASEQSRPWARMTANPSYKIMTWVGPDGRADTAGPGLKGIGAINPANAAMLFDGAPRSYADMLATADEDGKALESFDLPVKISMAGEMTTEDVTSPNVVGLIPGADPLLKNEYVILTAHLDHTGINERLIAEGKDGINNGAMDNATGIATMMEVARQFKTGTPPARSVMIVAVTAEEKGLLGSDYFAHFPTIGSGEMVANVNLDMPVMLHSFTDVIAFGAEHSSLRKILEDALAQTGVSLQPDPIPQLNIFVRSDHYRFVEQGVPAIYLWAGFSNGGEEKFWDFYKNHYHQPSDDISRPILYDDMARFADLNYIIARAIADAPEKPAWNEGDFFGDLFTK